MKNLIISLLLMAATAAQAQHPHLRCNLSPTPPMGWMSWNLFSTQINEQIVRDMADAMVDEGLRDAGYEYIYIDDLWQGGRDKQNNIIPDPDKFPSGMKALADYVHSKGLKLGIYSDAASLTCAGATGSLHFEEQDAKTFAEWGIDYLKYDYCNAPDDEQEASRRYATMAQALDKSGRSIVLGICEWGQHHPERWARQSGGQVWRTSGDVRDMWRDIIGMGGMGILDIIDVTTPLLAQSGKYAPAVAGSWPDMDMLVVGLYGKSGPSADLGGVGCSNIEYETQMSMWAMFASPLTMSNDLRQMNDVTRRILTNADIIAIDQDALGQPAREVTRIGDIRVYVRPLTGGRHAVALLNAGDADASAKVSFAQIGIDGSWRVSDVWAHTASKKKLTTWKTSLKAHQTQVLVLSEQ